MPMNIESVEHLDDLLATPSAALIEDVARVEGDILILGAGGKMGPSLARLAKNAVRAAGVEKRVVAVSRFSAAGIEQQLQAAGVETLRADLLDEAQLRDLPEVANVVYMVAMKFGTTGQEPLTWAMNAYLPGRVAERFQNARIVAFSTGNVYPLSPVSLGGASEDHPTGPQGEYAQSCLGRERILQHFSIRNGTPMALLRLNYAIDLRYGVLLDIAQAVKNGTPVDLSMGHVNVIWQGDANEVTLRAFHLCRTPPTVLNLTGPETISVRWLAEAFAERLGREPVFTGEAQGTALLNNAAKAHQHFGYPHVPLLRMIDWVASWVHRGGATLDKPTRFQARDGKF